MTASVHAIDHDRGCTANVADAGDQPNQASEVPGVPLDCRGEMSIQTDDNDDWFVVSLQDMANFWGEETAYSVEVCPDGTKVDPWNPDLEVYAGNKAPNVFGFGFGPAPIDQLGSSSNADSCDTVAGSHDFTGRQLFVHVHRTSGSGLYTLNVALG